MKFYKTDNQYILKIEKGENFAESIISFCQEHSIDNAHFIGIGAVEYVKCGYYELISKEYLFKEYNEIVEVTNVTGNVMKKEAGLFVHAHGTFADRDNQVFGGHIDEMRVGVVLEIILTPLSSSIGRTYDDSIGLYLMDI